MTLNDKFLFLEAIVSSILVITLILFVIIEKEELTSPAFLKRLEEKRSLVKTIRYLAVAAVFIFVNTEFLEFILPHFEADYLFYFDKAIETGAIAVVLMNIIIQSLSLYILLGIRSKTL